MDFMTILALKNLSHQNPKPSCSFFFLSAFFKTSNAVGRLRRSSANISATLTTAIHGYVCPLNLLV